MSFLLSSRVLSEISKFSSCTFESSPATASSIAFFSADFCSFSSIIACFCLICSSILLPESSASFMSAVRRATVSLLCSTVALRTEASPSLRKASSSKPEAPSLLCSIARFIPAISFAILSSLLSRSSKSFSQTSYDAFAASILCSCSRKSTVNLFILLSQTPISSVFFSSLSTKNFCAFSLCFLSGPTLPSSSARMSSSRTRFSCACSSLLSASRLLWRKREIPAASSKSSRLSSFFAEMIESILP